MKKLLAKLCLFIIPVFIYLGASIYIDAYNVFHVDNIRLTYVTPNQNFIKTKYVLNNKDRFNAFVLGSSRAGNLPLDGLPKMGPEGQKLHWYNMTYAMGCPEENYQTVRTFLDNGVKIEELVILVDEISMWRNAFEGTGDLIFATYQTYEENPLKFYYAYIKQKPLLKLLPAVIENDLAEEGSEVLLKKSLFYEYGVGEANTDMAIGSPTNMFEPERSLEYTEASTSVESVRRLKEFCDENGIELLVITSPVLESTYRQGVDNGYLDFLTDLASVTDYYCFSGLNAYTREAMYYFDASHFRPYVGREMEKVLFGNDNERMNSVSEACSAATVVPFGTIVTADNVDEVIGGLVQELGK